MKTVQPQGPEQVAVIIHFCQVQQLTAIGKQRIMFDSKTLKKAKTYGNFPVNIFEIYETNNRALCH